MACFCFTKQKPNLKSAAFAAQNESSIVQAIVSQSIPGISPRICLPTTPVYNEKSRLVPMQGQFIVPQTKTGANLNPLANAPNSGRLQADLSQLEASYQAGLQAKQIAQSNASLNLISDSVSICNESKQNASMSKTFKKDENETLFQNDNNNDVSTNDNEVSNVEPDSQSKIAVKNRNVGRAGNKWPLKPGVLVHVNSNHSLSPKKFGRNAAKIASGDMDIHLEEISIAEDSKRSVKQQKDLTKIGILERDCDIIVQDLNENRDMNQSIKFDKDKCRNLMKSERPSRKKSRCFKLFNKIDFLRTDRNLKSDEDECISDSDGATSKTVKRTKSNKRALSLVGFSLKDGRVDKKGHRSKLRSCFQSSSPIIPSEGGIKTFILIFTIKIINYIRILGSFTPIKTVQ